MIFAHSFLSCRAFSRKSKYCGSFMTRHSGSKHTD